MSPEINDIIMALKAHAALYWNLPLIKANISAPFWALASLLACLAAR